MEEKELSLEELQTKLDVFQNLVKSPGWEALVEIAEGQLKLREVEILSAEVNSLDDAFIQSRLRAERLGIKLFIELPSTIVNELKEETNALVDEAQIDE